MRIVKRILSGVLCLVVILVLAGAGWAGYLVYRAQTGLPQVDGIVRHDRLAAEVQVVRDDWGVPHIEAKNEPDAYFALGYLQAQDRLFQLELMRRLAQGRLSELLGPPLIKVDKIIRTFRLKPKAEQYIADHGGEQPKLRAASEAYAAGINAFMEDGPLPFEFSALGIPAEPFTPVDCLSVAAILPITFADGIREDPLASMLDERHPDLNVWALFPGYHQQAAPVTVMESREEARQYLLAHAKDGAARSQSQAEDRAAEASVAVLEGLLAEMHTFTRLLGPALGSNSWVVSGEKTKSGKPILANDPHIGFTNPSIWYEAHIKFPGHELYGFHLPLIPFALLGHNRHHAWALTMFANDDVDMYRETFHPDNPNKVKYKGEWVDVRTDTGTIGVRFWPDQEYTVRTTPHGPVITDLLHAMTGYDGPDVSLSWVWQHTDYTDILAFYRMGRAKSYEAFEEGVSLVTSPGVNVSYADAGGNIAWWAAGRIPVRPKHVNNKSILDGASGDEEILDYVPFEKNPHLKNPAWGYIATANNKSTVKPVGRVDDLEGYWQPDDRAGRIEELLEARDDWDLEAMKEMQFDDKSFAAPGILARLFDAVAETGIPLSDQESLALRILKTWDFRHGTDSVGATLFWVFNEYAQREAVYDEIGPGLYDIYLTLADSWNYYKYAVDTPDLPFWDNLKTPELETRDHVLISAFKAAVAKLRERYGPSPQDWTWGRIHTMEFKHPFGYLAPFGRFLNIGPFPASGSHHMINNMIFSGDEAKYEVIAGPSTRRVIDFADPTESYAILPTGNSGNVASPHYDDQAEMFMNGEYRMVRFTEDQIAANTRHELRFVPAG